MASTSPYDGRPPDPPPDSNNDVSFVRTIRPPKRKNPSKIRIVARAIWSTIRRILVAILGGSAGVLVYLIVFSREREFQLLPPWSFEAPIIFSVFLFTATCAWLLSRKRH